MKASWTVAGPSSSSSSSSSLHLDPTTTAVMELGPRAAAAAMTFYSLTAAAPFYMAGLDAHLRRLHRAAAAAVLYPENEGRPSYVGVQGAIVGGPQHPLIDALLHGSKHCSSLVAHGLSCFTAAAAEEEQKPSHSYIGLIAMAILNSTDCKLVLSDIYQWILDNYSYFRSRGPGWRNSIRHNLSLNDCFVKSGRSANGKGHYWAIHPANLEDFQKGDFRRRRAQRKARKAMGLAVPDDEEGAARDSASVDDGLGESSLQATEVNKSSSEGELPWSWPYHEGRHGTSSLELVRFCLAGRSPVGCWAEGRRSRKKRSFDVESILAPDDEGPEVETQ